MVIGVIAHESGGASWPMSHRRSMDDRHQRHGDAAAFAEEDVVGPGGGGGSHDLDPDPLPFQRLAEGLRHVGDL